MSAAASAPATTVDRSWWSWAGPHGGYVAGLCLDAAVPLLGEGRSPRSLHAVFLAPVPEGAFEPEVALLREGGSSAVVTVGVDAALHVTVVGGRARGDSVLDAAGVTPPPAVPGPDDCADTALPVELVPFSQHLQWRFATGARPFTSGDRAELVAWVRLVDDRPLGAADLVMLTDAMPPALYAVAATPVAVPTVDLTVSFTGAGPASGWVLLRITTLTAEGGWCLDDSEVWDVEGRLLVRGRQTRRVLGEWA